MTRAPRYGAPSAATTRLPEVQIAAGIEDGSIRTCNPKLAAFAIIGALNGIADWYRQEGELTVEAIADEFALRLTEGLAARPSRARATAGPKAAAKRRKR